MKTTPKPSQIAILAGAVVMLLFSFIGSFVDPGFGDGYNAWSGDWLFPLTVIPLLLGLVVAGTTAASIFGDVKLPEPILGFTWKQLNVILAFGAVVILVPMLVSAPSGADAGVGLILSALGSIALLAGAVMEHLGIEVGGTSGGGSTQAPGGPSTPF